MEQRKPGSGATRREHAAEVVELEGRLEDEGRGWCGVRTYITGPQTIRAGKSGDFKSNCHIDFDEGCKSADIDEVSWTITDVPNAYQNWIHIQQQTTGACLVKIEAGVPSGTQFTLHATPKGHATGKGTNARIACQVNKADSQVVSVS
jgi:hypothetical protein